MSCPGNGGRDDNALLFSKPEKDKALSLYSQQYALWNAYYVLNTNVC